MGSATQLELPLGLKHEPPVSSPTDPDHAAKRARLEHRLTRDLGRRLVIKLTTNRRHLVSGRVRAGVLNARIHVVFLDAPDPVLDAIAGFLGAHRPSEHHQSVIQSFVTAHRDVFNRARRASGPRPAPAGHTHNLADIFNDLNVRFFGGCLQARITWSRGSRGQRRRSMQLGSYSPEEALIRIHPALDQRFVPAYFVSCVVFHEMLHAVHGVTKQNGRHRIHSTAFQDDERRHPDYARARRWEDKNLKRLLRY